MRFCNSYVIYAPELSFPINELGVFLREKSCRCISGMKSTIDYIKPIFDLEGSCTETKLLKLTAADCPDIDDISNWSDDIRELSIEKASEIQDFYLAIEEFRNKFSGDQGYQKVCEQFSNGRFIGTYVEGKLVCIFALSSEIEKFAILDSIATLADYRNHGIAYRSIRRVCGNEIRNNREKILLWPCEGAAAEKVAKKIGFTTEGIYSYFYPERVHGGGGKYKKG